MWNIAKIGKQESDIRLVVGNSGIGKTIVFKKFAEEISVVATTKYSTEHLTWNNFLYEICRGFGVSFLLKNHDTILRNCYKLLFAM
jgi:dephospho-CoA kinase